MSLTYESSLEPPHFFGPKVDGFVPHTQRVNLRKVWFAFAVSPDRSPSPVSANLLLSSLLLSSLELSDTKCMSLKCELPRNHFSILRVSKFRRPFWRARAVSCSEFDGFVPRTRDVNVMKVGQPLSLPLTYAHSLSPSLSMPLCLSYTHTHTLSRTHSLTHSLSRTRTLTS